MAAQNLKTLNIILWLVPDIYQGLIELQVICQLTQHFENIVSMLVVVQEAFSQLVTKTATLFGQGVIVYVV